MIILIYIFEIEMINSTADGYRSDNINGDNINNPASKAWITFTIYPTLVNGKSPW